MTLMFLPRIWVHSKVPVIVATLKILVRLNHEMHFWTHIRLQYRCSNGWVIGHADGLANVVTQRCDHYFIICTSSLGHCGCLQRMRQLISHKAIDNRVHAAQHL